MTAHPSPSVPETAPMTGLRAALLKFAQKIERRTLATGEDRRFNAAFEQTNIELAVDEICLELRFLLPDEHAHD